MSETPTKNTIEKLKEEIAACRICRDNPARGQGHELPHEPRPVIVMSPKARILIAGQAPGLRVHNSGLPFDDASGDRLRQWLGVDRETFYDPDKFAIVSMGFCFPGYNASGHDLPPRRECAPIWRQKVLATMPQVELMLVIGQYAQSWHLGAARKASVNETVVAWREYFGRNEKPTVMPLPHPSWRNSGWLKRNPWFEADLLPALQNRVKTLLS